MEDLAVANLCAEVAAGSATLATLIYRSRAAESLTSERLGEILDVARDRNAREGLSGLLLYDGTHFLQWLEGPADALDAVWSSIQTDPRHREVELVGRPDLPVRLFRGWDMGLAGHSRGIAEGVDDVVLVEQAFFDQLAAAGKSLGGLLDLLARVAPVDSLLSTAPRLEERADHVRVLCFDHVLPLVGAQYGLDVDLAVPRRSANARLPRIDPAFITRFADHLRISDHEAANRVWQRLMGLGCSPSVLCSDLVEPTARRLGDLWADDACSGADVTIAETELLMLIRRGTPPGPQARTDQPRVLVSSVPGSRGVLGPALAAVRLESMQCCTECMHPASDEELDFRLVETDTHNLVIALDPIHAQAVEPELLGETIRAAREAMHNRDLRVTLYGRQVADDPSIGQRTRADSAYATLAELNAATMDWVNG